MYKKDLKFFHLLDVCKNNIIFLLHPWNFEIQKQIIKFDDIGNGGHEKMPDITLRFNRYFSGLSGRARKTRVWNFLKMRSIIYGGERYGSSHYITIVWHFLWICKAKLNQELFISNEFSPVFNCENSVRKGEKLSVFFFIFHIYTYLIYWIFLIHLIFNAYPLYLKCLKQIKLNVFLKLFAFLYADDTIILLAKSSEELQKQLLKA